MSYVTSLFARKMVAAAGDGPDAAALLASIGIDADAPWDPKAMIPAGAYYTMLERLGESYSAVDLLLSSPFHWLPDAMPDDPSVQAWIRRCSDRPALKAVVERERLALSA